MPVRKIPKNSQHVTGVVAASAAEGRAGFEGQLERWYELLLDFNKRMVRRFEVQPVKVPWYDAKGKLHHYTPDNLVHFHDETLKPLLVEVKPRDSFWKEWREEGQKFRAAFRFAKSRGWRFTIMSEREIETQFLESVLFLTPFVRSGAASELDRKRLLRAMSDVEESTPQQLLGMITADAMEQAYLLPTFWFLVGTFQIGADLDQPLNMDMKIWRL